MIIALLLAVAAVSPAAERRCGWLENPTPNNFSLVDRDGEWIISEQGSYEAEGIEAMPQPRQSQWVHYNVGSYGYGCACLNVTTDREAMQVTRVLGGHTLRLAKCRADRRLPRR